MPAVPVKLGRASHRACRRARGTPRRRGPPRRPRRSGRPPARRRPRARRRSSRRRPARRRRGRRSCRTSRPARRKAAREQRREGAVRGGDGHVRAAPHGLDRVRRAAQAGDRALAECARATSWLGSVPCGREQALGQHQHAEVRRECASPSDSSARRQRPGRARPGRAGRRRRSRRSSTVIDADVLGQLDAGQVGGVGAVQAAARAPARRCGSRAGRSRPTRASSVATAVPQLPAPTTTAWRIGCRPPSHSHCSEMHDQTRFEISCAAAWRGSRSSGRGKRQRAAAADGHAARADAPAAADVLGADDRDRDDRARRSRAPGGRRRAWARRAGPGRTRVPSGKMPTAPPRSRITRAVSIAILVGLAAADREGAERQQDPRLPALVEQLDLGDEVQRAPQAACRSGTGRRSCGGSRRAAPGRPWGCARGRCGAGGSRRGRRAAGSRGRPSRRASPGRGRGRSGGRARDPSRQVEYPALECGVTGHSPSGRGTLCRAPPTG